MTVSELREALTGLRDDLEVYQTIKDSSLATVDRVVGARTGRDQDGPIAVLETVPFGEDEE